MKSKWKLALIGILAVPAGGCFLIVAVGGVYVIWRHEYAEVGSNVDDDGAGQIRIVPTYENVEVPFAISYLSSGPPYCLEIEVRRQRSPTPDHLRIDGVQITYPDGSIQRLNDINDVAFWKIELPRYDQNGTRSIETTFVACIKCAEKMNIDHAVHRYCNISVNSTVVMQNGKEESVRFRRRFERRDMHTIVRYWDVVSSR